MQYPNKLREPRDYGLWNQLAHSKIIRGKLWNVRMQKYIHVYQPPNLFPKQAHHDSVGTK